MKLKAIIIDDESNAIEALTLAIKNNTSDIEIVATTDKATIAPELIIKYQPDFIFIDIEMPGMSGFDILESIPDIEFDVIFVTAFDHYALKAIKANAIDYILKPIKIAEIIQAIAKVRERKLQEVSQANLLNKLKNQIKNNSVEQVKITTLSGIDFIDSKKVIRIEASGAYSILFLDRAKQHLVSKSIKEVEKLFTQPSFFRTHRSHIINLNHVQRYSFANGGVIIMSDDAKIPLSRRQKDKFHEVMDNK